MRKYIINISSGVIFVLGIVLSYMSLPLYFSAYGPAQRNDIWLLIAIMVLVTWYGLLGGYIVKSAFRGRKTQTALFYGVGILLLLVFFLTFVLSDPDSMLHAIANTLYRFLIGLHISWSAVFILTVWRVTSQKGSPPE